MKVSCNPYLNICGKALVGVVLVEHQVGGVSAPSTRPAAACTEPINFSSGAPDMKPGSCSASKTRHHNWGSGGAVLQSVRVSSRMIRAARPAFSSFALSVVPPKSPPLSLPTPHLLPPSLSPQNPLTQPSPSAKSQVDLCDMTVHQENHIPPPALLMGRVCPGWHFVTLCH